ncbi:MAG TPA: hypothetical protein VHS33_02500 [Sphingomicrobium sp.]|jgi:hypothetical protein|nr:hypothetical protein [Sphingomicrobium sp.]
MRKLLQTCVIGWLFFGAGVARAECSVSSDAGAVFRPLDATVQADADVIVSMTMLPKLMHVDYESASKRAGCDLGPLTTGGVPYELWGDDSGGHHRKAISANKGLPVALILPVIDLMKALTAQKQGEPARAEGYLLATITKGDFTGWRYYTGMPDLSTLKHDMTDSLAGHGDPIFRAGSDGKVDLFVPKN